MDSELKPHNSAICRLPHDYRSACVATLRLSIFPNLPGKGACIVRWNAGERDLIQGEWTNRLKGPYYLISATGVSENPSTRQASQAEPSRTRTHLHLAPSHPYSLIFTLFLILHPSPLQPHFSFSSVCIKLTLLAKTLSTTVLITVFTRLHLLVCLSRTPPSALPVLSSHQTKSSVHPSSRPIYRTKRLYSSILEAPISTVA